MQNILIWLFLIIAVACNKSKTIKKEKLLDEIAKYEQILLSDTTGHINISASYEVIKYYSTYANQFPDDSITPEFLYRKASILRNIGKTKEAIYTLTQIEKNYPNFANLDLCLFMIADIYENLLQDTAKARNYYNEVLNRFPNSTLSDDVKVILQHLGKNPDEILQQILKNDTIIKSL